MDVETIQSLTTSGQATPARLSSSGYIHTGTTTPGGAQADVGLHTDTQTYADIALPCPLPEDVATLKFELTRAAANNEILQSNVETLKALALQLAVQLEEANITINTLDEQVVIASMRNEVEINNSKSELQSKADARADALTAALAAAEETTRQTVVMWEDREAAAERRIAQLEKEKDRMIASLTNEIEVLRMGLHDLRQRDVRAHRHQASSSFSPRREPHPTTQSSMAFSPITTSASNNNNKQHKVAAVEVTVPSHLVDELRYGDDEHIPWLMQGRGTVRRPRDPSFDGVPTYPFLVNVATDASIADLTPLLPKASTGSDMDGDGPRKQGWTVRLVSGETMLISAELL